ncbi:leukocyte cell-derived chemotaxin-2-like isoform X3 [Ambystoma mexicanum]|uniref:leukocyte cell-derived chemotaxin-2-like isoform X3 n=1 Tax=Ambystoma mexicanum TaxID=8296 RepID=UPI0037E9B0A9
MDRVTLALLGGLLLCTGIPAGQATEAEPFTATTTTQYPNYPTTGYTPLPFTTGPEYAADQPFTVSREDLEPGPTTGNQYSSEAQPSTADTLYPTGSTKDQNAISDCVPTEPGRRFPLLSSGQRKNLIRRCDLYGCGCYGSPRGHSLLKGVDIVCRDGATVYAPFTGTVMSLERTYGDENDRPSGEGFMFVGSGFCLKIFNVHQDGQSGEITKGCRMGTLIPMQLKYPRITSHMHVQKCDLSDPTGLLS